MAGKCATVGCRETATETIEYSYTGEDETYRDDVCSRCADFYARIFARGMGCMEGAASFTRRPTDETLAQEIESGYEIARQMYGDDYAGYLRERDTELAAKGIALVPFPRSLQGNDGD
jgi:hypothetical protein